MSAALLGLVFATSGIAVWKRALSLGFAGAGLGRHLPESGAHQPGDRRRDADGLRRGHVSPEAHRAREPVLAARRRHRWWALSSLALTLGGPSIQERVMTLFASDPHQRLSQRARRAAGPHVPGPVVRVSLWRRPRALGDGRRLLSTDQPRQSAVLGGDSVHELDDRRRHSADRACMSAAQRDGDGAVECRDDACAIRGWPRVARSC